MSSGLASGLMMTGHEIGTALGVARLTAIAGNLATQAGLIDGYGRAFAAAGVLAALFVLTALAFPSGKPSAAGHGHRGAPSPTGPIPAENPAISPVRRTGPLADSSS